MVEQCPICEGRKTLFRYRDDGRRESAECWGCSGLGVVPPAAPIVRERRIESGTEGRD